MTTTRFTPCYADSTPRRGFTLLELIVVFAIVGVLSAIAIPLYLNYQERSQVKQAEQDMRLIETNLEIFRGDFGGHPNKLESAMDPVPLDPWGRPYQYLNLQGSDPGINGKRRKDKNLVPINSDYDPYISGADG